MLLISNDSAQLAGYILDNAFSGFCRKIKAVLKFQEDGDVVFILSTVPQEEIFYFQEQFLLVTLFVLFFLKKRLIFWLG